MWKFELWAIITVKVNPFITCEKEFDKILVSKISIWKQEFFVSFSSKPISLIYVSLFTSSTSDWGISNVFGLSALKISELNEGRANKINFSN